MKLLQRMNYLYTERRVKSNGKYFFQKIDRRTNYINYFIIQNKIIM